MILYEVETSFQQIYIFIIHIYIYYFSKLTNLLSLVHEPELMQK